MLRRLRYLLLLACFALTACAKEPMIKLSEENLAKINNNSLKKSSEVPEDDHRSIVYQTLPENIHGELAEPNTQFDLVNFSFFNSNRISYYSDGNIRYLEYVDTDQVMGQIRRIQDDQWINEIYKKDKDTLIQLNEFDPPVKMSNYLNQKDTEVLSLAPKILLKAPIQQGTTWINEDQSESRIQALYQQVTIQDQTYQEVVEVVNKKDQSVSHSLYSANQGLVAEWIEGEPTKFIYLTKVEDNVMIITPITVYQPVVQNDLSLGKITKEQASISWQTNAQVEKVFETFFKEQKWIGPNDQLLALEMTDQGLLVNLSQSVTKSFSQNPAGELAVVHALVTTLGHFYGVEHVQLQVQSMIYQPLFSLPVDQAIYTLDSSWIIENGE
ncbi:GerMN domain-containing protein [Facklamia hominis]